MNSKELQAKGNHLYVAPEVTVVAFCMDRGYALSNLTGNSTTNFDSDNSWVDMSDNGGSFGTTDFGTQSW